MARHAGRLSRLQRLSFSALHRDVSAGAQDRSLVGPGARFPPPIQPFSSGSRRRGGRRAAESHSQALCRDSWSWIDHKHGHGALLFARGIDSVT